MNIKIARFGIKWTGVSSIVGAILGVLQLYVVALFLGKSDYGSFAVLSIVIGLGIYFVDMGLGSAVVHQENPSDVQLGTAYFINVAAGIIVSLVVFFLANLISDFYENNELVALIRSVSVIFFLQSFGIQYAALMQKNFLFSVLAKIDIIYYVVGFSVTVFLASIGYGVWALVCGQIAAVFIKAALLFFLGKKIFGFRLSFEKNSLKFYARYGLYQISENIVNYFNGQVDVLMVGKFFSPEILGVYFMAKQLAFRPMQILNPIFTKVYLPIFSVIKNDEINIRKDFLFLIKKLSVLHVIIHMAIFVFSEEIVDLFLGIKWHGVSDILKIMSIYVMLRAISSVIGSVQLARGLVDLGFKWNLLLLFLFAPVIFIGKNFGINGVAFSLLILMTLLQIPFAIYMVEKITSVNRCLYILTVAKYVLSGCIILSSPLVFSDIYFKVMVFLTASIMYVFYFGHSVKR